MRKTIAFLTAFVLCGLLAAQSTAYVIHLGPTAGLQKWDNSNGREPLFQYHAAISMESINNEDNRSSFYAQLGYHVRGSANRFRYFDLNSSTPGGTFTERFKFNNFSFSLGVKQRFKQSASGLTRYFYFGGLRCDYTYSTNIDNLNRDVTCSPGLYPRMAFIRRWMGGFSVGGGIEFDLGELVGAQVQLSVNPDITNQYHQNVVLQGVIDRCNPGSGNVTIGEQRIRNTTLEVSIGLRLLRKVVVVE